MKDLVRRVTGSLKRLVRPARASRPAPAPAPRPHPSGLTTRCTGGRPLRGEDTVLVRPYVVTDEEWAERIALVTRLTHSEGAAA
ncbi:hypothetical protein [Streptomyces sp. NPDC002690]